MLESIEIERFKSLTSVEVDLGRITLLVGPNNAGKSSILQGVQFGVSVAQSLRMDGVAKWTRGELKGTLSTEQLVYTPLRDVHALASGGALRQDVATAIRVGYRDGEAGATSISVRRGKNKNISITVSGKDLGEKLEHLEAPFSVVAPGLAGIPAVEEYRTPGIVRRAAARGDANSVFRNVLWTLKQDVPAWNIFHESLNRVFDDVELDVEFDENTDEHIQATFRRGGTWLPIDSAGTGVLQAIQVLSYIGVYKPRLLVLDEPDSHLHPDNQRKLARLLDSLTCDGNLQVLVSTHSRHLLDELAKVDATIHWLSSGQLATGDFDRVSALLELGALDAGDRLRNGQASIVVITEDTGTKSLENLLVSSGLKLEDIDIWSYAGSSKVAAARILGRFIRETAPQTRVIVHRDRDYLDNQECEDYVNEFNDSGVEVFLTSGTDIESHFLDPGYLHEVYPELTVEELASIIDDATDELRNKSIEMLINHRVELANRRKRVTGEKQPSPGSISTQASTDFNEDPQRYRHGKKTLRAVRRIIHEKHGMSRSLVKTSDVLAIPRLRGWADPAAKSVEVLDV